MRDERSSLVSRLRGLDPAAVETVLDEVDFAGVVHVAGDDGEAPLTIERGLANRAAGVPNTIAMRFACASVSKLVTSMTVARLVDAGMVAWDARYVDVVGTEWRPAALDPTVTLRHLLGHTSGFRDYFDEQGDEGYEAIWTRIPPTLIRGPRDMWPLLRDLSQIASPGERAIYNNGAFVLVGIALEELTGLAFPDLARREVFGPLAMDRSGFWATDEPVPDLASGYLPPVPDAGPRSPEAGWRTNVFAVPATGGPDGGVQATAPDLVRVLDGLSGRADAASFLSAPTRAALIGPHVTSDDRMFRFGLGVLHVGEGGSTRYGHTGEDPGASARAWTYPETGERLVVVSNVTEGAGLVTRRIDALLAGN
jgi:CubicO group peptidase (beta-lactamase class C family)